ncbi:MAG: hypothetical protein ACRENS_01315 [Candidatus Eiseniibacteriota bacterium]
MRDLAPASARTAAAAAFASRAAAAGALSFALALGLALALAPAEQSRAQIMLPVDDPSFHKLKYADSLSSVNDRCVITHNRLNPAIHPLYVNGQPVGFC